MDNIILTELDKILDRPEDLVSKLLEASEKSAEEVKTEKIETTLNDLDKAFASIVELSQKVKYPGGKWAYQEFIRAIEKAYSIFKAERISRKAKIFMPGDQDIPVTGMTPSTPPPAPFRFDVGAAIAGSHYGQPQLYNSQNVPSELQEGLGAWIKDLSKFVMRDSILHTTFGAALMMAASTALAAGSVVAAPVAVGVTAGAATLLAGKAAYEYGYKFVVKRLRDWWLSDKGLQKLMDTFAKAMDRYGELPSQEKQVFTRSVDQLKYGVSGISVVMAKVATQEKVEPGGAFEESLGAHAAAFKTLMEGGSVSAALIVLSQYDCDKSAGSPAATLTEETT